LTQQTTLAELKARALDYADMTGSGFPDSNRLVDYINAGLSELHDILVNSYEDYFRKSLTFAIVNNQEEYDLPDDFYKVLKVYYKSSDRRFKMERFQLDEIDGYRTSALSGGDVEFWYIPHYHKLSTDNESVNVAVPVGWEDFVALHAAIRLLAREESDPAPLMAERERQRQRIVESAEPRDAGTANTVGDFHGRWNNAQHIFRFEERYLRYRVLGQKIHLLEFEYLGL
jgi:hypothetical protein